MDVTFATPRGREFTLEVWYFATVREVKEAVGAREGVPAASQRLFLGGRELDDDARDAAHYGVLQGSRILLLLPDDDDAENAAPPSSPDSATSAAAAVRVAVSAPAIGRTVALDARATDTVARVKEILQDRTDGALAAARSALFFDKAEMEDGRALADYDPPAEGVMELCVVVRQPPTSDAAEAAGGGNGGGARNQQKIAVKVMFGARVVALEVGAMDVVRDLRKEVVERLRLPVHDGSAGGGGYFFVYKQNVMDEDRTLRWHDVKNGDTIEIFNGTVTGGA
jgi:ubiquitin C